MNMQHCIPSAIRRISILLFTFMAAVGVTETSLQATDSRPGPLRILYFGRFDPDAGQGTNYTYLPGQTLAREAIHFDHTSDPTQLRPERLRHYDAVVLVDAEGKIGAAEERVLTEFTRVRGGGVKRFATGTPPDDSQLKSDALSLVSILARARHESFLRGREPLRHEPRDTVANYERRPEPLPYQLPLSAVESMKHTQVPADMELQLFASEPDIVRPIALAWDERGRLWVIETPDYPHALAEGGRGTDRITICEDTDGDGKADKYTVFADQLNIPTSMVFARGGLIVAQAPHFLFLKDTNGDDKVDVREVLFANAWGTGDTHAGPSSLAWGLDNWLYGTVGYAGFRQEKEGVTNRFAQGVYRFRADGSQIEFLHQFNNNTWGFAQNAAGDVFGSTANNHPTFFGTLPQSRVPVVPGQGRGFGGRGRGGIQTAISLKPGARMHPNTPNIRQVDAMGGYTAAAGHNFIYSDAMPARLQGRAMVCEPTCKLIGLFDYERNGAGYAAHDALNLLASSDEWMSPVFSDVGPDGAIWVADWYNFIIQHNPTPSEQRGGYRAETGRGGAHVNPLRDNTRGRIYRIVWKDAPARAQKLDANASTPELVAALDSDNKFWRLTAQRLLVDGKKTEVADSLKALIKTRENRPGAVHALFTLQGIGALDRATHQGALLSRDAVLRRAATRALGADESARQLLFESAVIHDPDLTTRMAALSKLAEFPTTPEIQTLVAGLRREPTNQGDPILNSAGQLLARVHQVPAAEDNEEPRAVTGDATRGAEIFQNHAIAACARCHSVGGKGGNVGPALDGIASRKDEAYIVESLMEPNARIAEGYNLPVSPMPPAGLILKEQEIADLKAYLMTLRQ